MVESDLENRQLLYNSLDTIMLCFFVALGCSLLFFILVQFLPKIMNYVVIALGMITILASGVCLFYYETTFTTFKIVLGCLLVLSFIIIVFLIIQNMDSIRMYGIFLQASTQFVKDRPFALLYIPLFLLLIAGFIAMVVL